AKVSNIPLDTGYLKIKDEISFDILRYLKDTRDMIMQLGKRGIFENILHGYADADWGGDTAEVIALSEACQEAMWLEQLLKDFGEEVIEIKNLKTIKVV
ncbi:hypothetical protein JTB14_000645, partial [Gonioctena quinquepunctata]